MRHFLSSAAPNGLCVVSRPAQSARVPRATVVLATAPRHEHLDRHAALCVRLFDLHNGQRLAADVHREHRLAWAESEVLTIEISGSSWILPPTLALWIPAGVAHTTSATRPTRIHRLSFTASIRPDFGAPADWSTPTVVAVTPLLRALVARLALDDRESAAWHRAEAVMVDELRPVSVTTIDVPMPSDPRARAVADALVENPADPKGLDRWGAQVGASVRTLTRLFANETGLPFTRWRTQIRICAALGHLASGDPIGIVARKVGYRSASAFVASFHRETGQTPGAYFSIRR